MVRWHKAYGVVGTVRCDTRVCDQLCSLSVISAQKPRVTVCVFNDTINDTTFTSTTPHTRDAHSPALHRGTHTTHEMVETHAN